MKKLIFLILLLPFCADAQKPYRISRDSLKNILELGYKNIWRSHTGDSAVFADPSFNDNSWDSTITNFYINSEFSYKPFNGIEWFRLHFIADTSIVNTPLAIVLGHYGASEVFLDGKKIAHAGVINGKDSTKYANPHRHTFAFFLRDTGVHVLAIRYANYKAGENFKKYRIAHSGFEISMAEANTLAWHEVDVVQYTSYFSILLFGIFITLGVLHLFLFLYYRKSRLNLYFCLFCFSVALVSLLIYMSAVKNTPGQARYFFYSFLVLTATMIYSLSGFSNELFSRRKLRFRIFGVACLSSFLINIFFLELGQALYFFLFMYVLLEAIVLTIVGIVRKVKGARILGTGIILFAGFIVFLVVLGLIRRSLEFSGSSGDIFGYLALCAILSIPASMSIYLSWSVAATSKELQRNLQQVEDLSARAIEQEKEKKRILEQQNETLEREVAARTSEVVSQKEQIEKQHEELKTEKQKSDNLLLNILPAEVADELKETGHSKARLFNHVSVLFTDFVGFTRLAETLPPDELVNELDTCFKSFDEIVSKYGIEKIKTIGDAYLAVCGLPEPLADHAERVASAALEIISFLDERRKYTRSFDIRIGIHSGSVVAGIVGVKKFAYDIWGDTVNTAARLEQHSEPGKINISESTYELIRGKFACTYRGKIEAKNKGELSMYFIEGKI